MELRIGLTVAAALLAATFLATSTATAATEFGDNCVADGNAIAPVAVFDISAPANPLPTAAPTAGVITRWKVSSSVPSLAAFPTALKVLRPTGANTVQNVGEEIRGVVAGLNVFDTRIPVQAGDHLGLQATGGGSGTLGCKGPGPKGQIGLIEAGVGGVGSLATFLSPASESRVPVSAVLEPDADSDGYGDETQDRCPQSAAFQTECPVLVLDSYPLPKKAKVVVLIVTSASTQVTVSGTAKLPKGPEKAKGSAQAKLAKVTKPVTAGKVTQFALRFPATLRTAVAALAPAKSLTVNLEATSTDIAGGVVKDKSKLKLKG